MKLMIFNSLLGKRKAFNHKNAKIYVCGITPYDTTHLGHAFTYTFFDTLIRYLRYKGNKVKYVQNITDIDDDILKKAKEVGLNWKQLGLKWTRRYLEDMRNLNNLKPDMLVKATAHIPQMTNVISLLLKRGLAYERNGSVYFSVEKFKDLGKLSKLPKEKMLSVANQRGNVPKDPNKKNPLDFVLWQSMKEGEPYWNSPWGKGRPGWHIECSAMIIENLGHTIDIHGGGKDLQFPHHEFEIAQSENYTGKKFVRFWVHVAMLRYRGKKMSKSLGNLIMINDLLKNYSANTIRILLLSHHYRNSWNYTENEMKRAQKLDKLFNEVFRQKIKNRNLNMSQIKKRFFSYLEDDMKTHKSLETLKELSNKIIKNGNTAESKMFFRNASEILGLKYV